MSEVTSRSSASRGRGSGRGGRGGFAGRGGRRPNGSDKPDHSDSPAAFDDDADLGELRKLYGDKTSVIREMFPDWSEADVLFALQETNGDQSEAVTRIAEGTISQWGEVSKTKKPARTKAKDAPAAASTTNEQTTAPRAARGGRTVSEGGRGRGRATERGGRGGAPRGRTAQPSTNGATRSKENQQLSVPTEESSAWGETKIKADPVETKPVTELPASQPAAAAAKTWASMLRQSTAVDKPAPLQGHPKSKPAEAAEPAEAPQALPTRGGVGGGVVHVAGLGMQTRGLSLQATLASPTANPSIVLIEQLSKLAPQLANGDNTEAKNQAIQLSRQLTGSLSHPASTAVELAFAPFVTVAARIAIGMGLFKLIANNNAPISSKQLAERSGSEEMLIIRTLRPLASVGVVKEAGERQWEPTPVTHAMATEEISAGHRMIGEMIVGAAQKAPKYLKEYGYRCPTDPRDGFMQFAFQTKMTTFELFSSIPQVLKDFNLFMGNTMGARNYWVDWFPVEQQLLGGANDQAPLLVDVGGGKGHDLLAFHERYHGRGKLVLQDLDSVTDSVKSTFDPAIDVVTYDFFTVQPIKGARAYFYHHILHDWSDEKCSEILEALKKSMAPGYSKLLLHEMIVPEEGASTFHAMLDMTMMAFNAGMERTERQWHELLDKAGFEVIQFWMPPQEDADGIVEAMLKS
ncbi:O-methyltransferase, family 2 [Cordyceps fumosorosea ARSEF 2679]|uniref:RNA polymerase II degradation factor 1 n=1 Tax=Cordyceps fumosorosea (strain ARSEF 2679) TaxID=1081104 RepID=A0A162JS40_CORFA|nr:O-methyltransferase, family 2 [Cordyceps fumosorosea ARSEF 2679]OAA46423.1 O-methyltransferase, family 2 [Cordyceps fumosorosea ARSEF 2679]